MSIYPKKDGFPQSKEISRKIESVDKLNHALYLLLDTRGGQ